MGDVRCLNIWDASFLRLYIWLEVLYTIGVCGRWKNSQKSVLTSKLDARFSVYFFAVQIVSSILHNFLENSNMLGA